MSDSLNSLRPVVILLLLLCSFRECSKRAAEQAAAIVCLQSLGVHDGRSKTETAWCQWKSFKSGIEYMQTNTKSSRKNSSSWLDPLFLCENTWSTGNRRRTEESLIQLFFHTHPSFMQHTLSFLVTFLNKQYLQAVTVAVTTLKMTLTMTLGMISDGWRGISSW